MRSSLPRAPEKQSYFVDLSASLTGCTFNRAADSRIPIQYLHPLHLSIVQMAGVIRSRGLSQSTLRILCRSTERFRPFVQCRGFQNLPLRTPQSSVPPFAFAFEYARAPPFFGSTKLTTYVA